MAKTVAKESKSSGDSKLYGALAYLLGLVTGVVVLLLFGEKDKFAKFHALQSILLSLVVLVVFWVLSFMLGVLTIATLGTGLMVSMLVLNLLGLAVLVLVLYCMVKAYSGEEFKLPVIGEKAKELAG